MNCRHSIITFRVTFWNELLSLLEIYTFHFPMFITHNTYCMHTSYIHTNVSFEHVYHVYFLFLYLSNTHTCTMYCYHILTAITVYIYIYIYQCHIYAHTHTHTHTVSKLHDKNTLRLFLFEAKNISFQLYLLVKFVTTPTRHMI